MAEGDYKEKWRYQEELPEDRSNIAPALKLLDTYSRVPPTEIDSHVVAVRNKAFEIFHYPCIGRWRFLDIYIAATPEYPEVIARVKAGETLLDVGCCFGQVLRQLVADGAPDNRLAGTDLRPEFIELGYDLFRDKESLKVEFVTGDVLNAGDDSLRTLDGRFNIIHVASFFHLFNWDDQVEVGVRLTKFLRPGAKPLILGRQVGTRQPTDRKGKDAGMLKYLHNIETFQALWNEIGKKTGTRWKVTGELFESDFDDVPRVLLRFVVRGL